MKKTQEKKTLPSSLLNGIVFLSGTVVMILELTGSRILAPYVGGSLPVWTGLIGIILGSLSIGYMLGGKLADQKPTYTMLGFILLVSALVLCLIPVASKTLLPIIVAISYDIRVTAVLAALILFALPSVLLGMVSPYAIRLSLESVSTSGETAGKLYALSTVGSIAGTFFAGFFLISYFGNQTIVYALAALLFLLAGMAAWKSFFRKIPHITLVIAIIVTADFVSSDFTKNLLDADTSYNRVIIYDTKDHRTQRPIREMLIGNERSSAMFLDGNDLVYDYTNYYRLSEHFLPDITHGLMIGGAGYSYPKYLQQTFPKARVDVVEIDPKLTDFAKEYFAFTPTPNITVYHEDARTFFNREEKEYDVIFNDAFASYYSHPFQLATREAIQHMANMITPNGIVMSNIISALDGDKGKFLQAEYHTYKSVFPYVYVFPVRTIENPYSAQNIMVVASKEKLALTSEDKEMQEYLSHLWKKEIPHVQILTDEYAPVEQYAMKMFE
ncbi:MAG: fused MFS/spermidine synthase [Patescibacteria group bacterium]